MKNSIFLYDDSIKTPYNYSYKVESILGYGGTSVVYNGTREDKKQKVIIKELLPKFMYGSLSRDDQNVLVVQESEKEVFEKMKKRFSRQCEQLNSLLRQGSLHFLLQIDDFEANNTAYAVYYASAGKTLNEIKKFDTIVEVAQIVDGVLECLEPIHNSGFLHLDISPDNIFVSETIINNRKKIMLIDYGSIFQVPEHSSELSEEDYECLSHKDKYSANELFRSVEYHEYQKLSRATDLYSIAAVLYKLIFGHAPNALEAILGVTWERLNKHPLFLNYSLRAMKKCAALLTKGLASDMENRYQTIREMRKDIRLLLNYCDNTKHYLNYELPPRNPNFFGREKELGQMQRFLLNPVPKKNVQRAIYVYGEDGMGKTELCIEFCYRFQERYDNICFLHFTHDFNNTFTRMKIQNLSYSELVLRDDRALFDQMVHFVNQIEGKTLLIIEDIRHVVGEKQYIDIARMAGDNIQLIFTSSQEQRSFSLEKLIQNEADLKIIEPMKLMDQVDVLPFNDLIPDIQNGFIGTDSDLQEIANHLTKNTLLLSYAKIVKEKTQTDLFSKLSGEEALKTVLLNEYCDLLSQSSLVWLGILSSFGTNTIDSVLFTDFKNVKYSLTELQEFNLVKIENTGVGCLIFINPLIHESIPDVIAKQKENPQSLLCSQRCERISVALSLPPISSIEYWTEIYHFYIKSWEDFHSVSALLGMIKLCEQIEDFCLRNFPHAMPGNLKAIYQELIKMPLDDQNNIESLMHDIKFALRKEAIKKSKEDYDALCKAKSQGQAGDTSLKNYPFYYMGMTIEKQLYELKNLHKFLKSAKPVKKYKPLQ